MKTELFAYHGEIKGSKLKTRIAGTEAHSKHRATGSTAASAVSPSVYKAIKAYVGITNGAPGFKGAIGYTESGALVAELEKEDNTDIFVLNEKSLLGGTFNKTTQKIKQYTLGVSKRYGTGIIFAAMPELLKDEEFKELYDIIKEDILRDEADIADFEKYNIALAKISDNTYQRAINGNILQGVKSLNISKITFASLNTGIYKPKEVLIGEFEIFSDTTGSVSSESGSNEIDREKFLKDYILEPERVYDNAEKSLIPTLPSSYIINETAIDIVSLIKGSHFFKEPMKNFYLYGSSGSGKSMMSVAVAAALNIPRLVYCCGPDTDKFDLLGQFVFGKDESELDVTVEDIIFDYETAYKKLTGAEVPMGYSMDECLELFISMTKQEGFKFQPSPIIEAVQKGYLVEIQEITACKSPTALEVLNCLLENNGEITLPDGTRVKRHPSTVVIATANTQYAGNKEINHAIKSRMSNAYRLDLPSKEDTIKRVLARSECNDSDIITRMVDIVQAIDKHCQDNDLNGMCGLREIINWANRYMITKNAYDSCINTVINKITSDEEFQQELITSILDVSTFA